MNKVAVVTGASKGIGLAITEMLLAENWIVYGVSRSGDGPADKNFKGISFDLSKVEQIPSLIKRLPEKIDLIVNNAGHWPPQKIAEISLSDIDEMFHLNFYTPVLLTSKLLKNMQKGGMVVNISSRMSIITDEDYCLYSASKSALDRFSTTLAKERPDLVSVSVMPSGTITPGKCASQNEDIEGLLKPEQISAVVQSVLQGKYPSGSLISIINDRSRDWWETRDKYDLVVDLH